MGIIPELILAENVIMTSNKKFLLFLSSLRKTDHDDYVISYGKDHWILSKEEAFKYYQQHFALRDKIGLAIITAAWLLLPIILFQIWNYPQQSVDIYFLVLFFIATGLREFVFTSRVNRALVTSLKKKLEAINFAAQNNDSDALYYLGRIHNLDTANPDRSNKAYKLISQAAANGHARAQYYLYEIYLVGQTVEQNYDLAIKWLKKAADQGLAVAQYDLGMAYAFGEITTTDSAEALSWLKKAAKQDFVKAQTELGIAYLDGILISKNPIEAYKWLSLAASRDDKAAERIEPLKQEMSPAHISQATELATQERLSISKNSNNAI